jgi:hypothetical protein
VLSEETGEGIPRNGMLDEAGLMKVPYPHKDLPFYHKLLLTAADVAVISSVYLVNIVC